VIYFGIQAELHCNVIYFMFIQNSELGLTDNGFYLSQYLLKMENIQAKCFNQKLKFKSPGVLINYLCKNEVTEFDLKIY